MTDHAYHQTSIYLTTEDKRLVDELQQRTGLKRSSLIRLAVQRMYHGDNLDRQTRLLEIAEEIRQLA